jgi:hypothetical protein
LLKSLWKEPLVHFLLIGAVMFTVFELKQEEDSVAPNRILVDAERVEQLVARFSRTRLRPPTDIELERLIESHVREEVYYRRALAMGLDLNDPVIRQRMRQKLEFLLEDLADEAAPDNEQLMKHMQSHPEEFREALQLSFTQVYLNPDKHQDIAADSVAILARLNSGAIPETEGDQTSLEQELLLADPFQITRIFGDSFAQQIVALQPGGWIGPLYSTYGGHLVKVSDKRDERFPPLEEVRKQVERNYLFERRQELKNITYRKLRDGYEIVIEKKDGTTAAVTENTSVVSDQSAQ